MSVESKIFELLQGNLKGADLVDALNKIEGAGGISFNTEFAGTSLINHALPKGLVIPLLSSNIGGEFLPEREEAGIAKPPQDLLLVYLALQKQKGLDFEELMTVPRMKGHFATNSEISVGGKVIPLVGIALAHSQIKQFLKHATHLTLPQFLESYKLEIREDGTLVNKETGEDVQVPNDDFKQFLELALMNLVPKDMQDFSLATAEKYGQPDFGNGIILYDELIAYSRAVGQLEHLWDSYTSPAQQKGLAAAALQHSAEEFTAYVSSQVELNIPINAIVQVGNRTVSLISQAISGSNVHPQKFTEFLKVAQGKLHYMAMVHGKDGVQVPIILPLLAFGKFTEFDKSGHSDGQVNIGNAEWGAQIIYMCVQGGGEPQWDALVGSEKLVGMLENVNSLVQFQHDQVPLQYVLGYNLMLNKVMEYLVDNGQLQFKPDIDGDGTERGADAKKKKHFENEIDLGIKTFPNHPQKQLLKIGDGVEEVVTPIFMYQVPTTSKLVGTMFAQGKLVMNLSGDVFDTAVRYMLQTDMVKAGGVWFKAVIYHHQSDKHQLEAKLEVAALVSGGPEESKHHKKLVYGCMPKNLLKGCEDACKGSTIKSSNSNGEMSVDPRAPSTIFWLKPFLAQNAQLVDVQFLTDHQVPQDRAEMLLGKGDFEEGMPEHYWA